MGDIASLVLTAGLVAITAYYAWQNRRMVEEMRATRAIQVLPKLALQWYRAGPTMGFVRVTNVGPGPALDVDVTIEFQPQVGTGAATDRRRLQSSLMAPGEFEDAFPGPENQLMDMPTLVATYERIELTGFCSDATGAVHSVSDALQDLAAWRETRIQARLRWEEPRPEKRWADAFDKKFGNALKQVATESSRLRGIVESRLPSSDDTE